MFLRKCLSFIQEGIITVKEKGNNLFHRFYYLFKLRYFFPGKQLYTGAYSYRYYGSRIPGILLFCS